HVAGRQYRRRAVELDRDAWRDGQGQAAPYRRPQRQGRPRLCRLAVGLMAAYLLHKLCHRVFHDDPLRAAVKRGPAAAIADWRFTPEERKALLEGDVRKLYEWGTHPFLLAHTTRWGLFGLTPALYAERIKGARDPS